MEAGTIIFDPLLPWASLWAGIVLGVLFVGFALFRRLKGWWLRGLSLAAILVAISNPSLQVEDRDLLSDIVLLVVDESSSQKVSDRPDQTAEAISELEAEVARIENTELRVVRLGDSDENRGTLLMEALSNAMAAEPRNRLAAAILLTDGQLHDVARLPDMPAPLHALLTGRTDDWDRRLLVTNAPAFAILGEPVSLTLRIEDQGQVPVGLSEQAEIEISVDGEEPQRFEVPIGQDLELPVTLQHGGMNVIQFTLPEQPGELTARNNSAVVQINGVRDRLRVLLVSGEPHAGERTWRNLLKSDASVDLVHFTILRPPEKQDGVPVNELSLIAFPTRELFLDKVDEFDLIIFDRYKRRGILPSIYLDNVRQYIEGGGALLIAAGPDFASADSIYRSPLSEVVPAEPTGRVLEDAYWPKVSEVGQRHPVTEGFQPELQGPDDAPDWGRWMRLVDVVPDSGTTVMSGLDDRPLLILDRVGEGRVALLASDHAWLWSRGFDGGGPQLELLRRLAHWMMKEPDLEEEALRVTAEGQTVSITRQTLGETAEDVIVTAPDGTEIVVQLEESAPGQFSAVLEGPDIGLYRFSDGSQDAIIALGPAAPREFENTIASDSLLAEPVATTRGGVRRISDGIPDIRVVRPGRIAAGRGWLGITPRGAYLTADISVSPLLPAWAMLLLSSLFAIGAWLYEGRR